MANYFGYAYSFTDRPDVWRVDGYVSVGATGAPTLDPSTPLIVVKSIVRTGVGAYTLTLQQPPKRLNSVDVRSIIDPSLSPAYVGCQLTGNTIGQAGVVNPVIKFQFNVGGTPTELPSGSGFYYNFAITVT